MVHLSDLDWQKAGDEVIKDYKKGDNVKAVVLDVDGAKERISLGVKQLAGDPADTMAKYKKGDAVTCTVTSVGEAGIEVKIADSELTAFVKRGDLSRDRSEQRPERYNVGDKVDAAVISVDKAARRIAVSIKALEIAEEKQAVAHVRIVRLGRLSRRHLQGGDQEARRRRRRERVSTNRNLFRTIEARGKVCRAPNFCAAERQPGCSRLEPCLPLFDEAQRAELPSKRAATF